MGILSTMFGWVGATAFAASDTLYPPESNTNKDGVIALTGGGLFLEVPEIDLEIQREKRRSPWAQVESWSQSKESAASRKKSHFRDEERAIKMDRQNKPRVASEFNEQDDNPMNKLIKWMVTTYSVQEYTPLSLSSQVSNADVGKKNPILRKFNAVRPQPMPGTAVPKEDDVVVDRCYPFTNMVFEACGSKALAYCGALQVLEENNVVIHRWCGTGVSAILATLAATGYSAKELTAIFMELDLGDFIPTIRSESSNMARYKAAVNVFRLFGLQSNQKAYSIIGELLQKKTGSADITFKQLFELQKVELCIVGLNVNRSSLEYFHVKTWPNLPVRRAVRIALCTPFISEACKEYDPNKNLDCFFDASTVCRYPIQSFDGWWLDGFGDCAFMECFKPLRSAEKFQSHRARFGSEKQWRTVGLRTYDAPDRRDVPKNPQPDMCPHRPVTDLSTAMKKTEETETALSEDRNMIERQVAKVLREKEKAEKDNTTTISTKGFLTFVKKRLTNCQSSVLNLSNAPRVFDLIDTNNTKTIEFEELLSFLLDRGYNAVARYPGFSRVTTNNVQMMAVALNHTTELFANGKFHDKADEMRTCAIDTDYITSDDYDLDGKDKAWLVLTGRCYMKEFLDKWVCPACQRAPSRVLIDCHSALCPIKLELTRRSKEAGEEPAEGEIEDADA